MKRSLCLAALLPGLALCQSNTSFEAADVHVSPLILNPFVRTSIRDGVYQLRQATMLDLIRIAWRMDPACVLGGPSWLELSMRAWAIVTALAPFTLAFLLSKQNSAGG